MSQLYPNTYRTFEEIPDTIVAKDLTDAEGMFYDCYKLKTVDLSHIDTSNAISAYSMFANCNNLEDIDTSKIVITNKCKNLNSMFRDCQKLKRVNISNWDTSSVGDMGSMFSRCYALEEIIGEFDLSSCSCIYLAFDGCNKLNNVKFKNVPKTLDLVSSGLTSNQYTVLNYI